MTRDPDIRWTQGAEQMCLASFTVAVDRKTKDSNGRTEADFISCRAFKKTAEFIGKYFTKGQRIGLSGHIMTGSYQKQDGTKVYTTDVVVEDVEFVESKANSENNGGYTVQANHLCPAERKCL